MPMRVAHGAFSPIRFVFAPGPVGPEAAFCGFSQHTFCVVYCCWLCCAETPADETAKHLCMKHETFNSPPTPETISEVHVALYHANENESMQTEGV